MHYSLLGGLDLCFVLVYKPGKIIIKPHGYTMILDHRGLVMSCTVSNITKSIELVTSITLVKLNSKVNRQCVVSLRQIFNIKKGGRKFIT